MNCRWVCHRRVRARLDGALRRWSEQGACVRASSLPQASEKGEVLLRGVGSLRYVLTSVKTLLVKCPSVQWQPDGLTIHTKSGS